MNRRYFERNWKRGASLGYRLFKRGINPADEFSRVCHLITQTRNRRKYKRYRKQQILLIYTCIAFDLPLFRIDDELTRD